MKPSTLLSFIFAISFLVSCLVPPAATQKIIVPEETLLRYRKFIPQDEEIISSSYQTVITKTPDGKFKKRIYYPEKYQCTSETTFSSSRLLIEDGIHKTWSDDGIPVTVGQYLNGEKHGIWTSIQNNKEQSRSETNYINGKREGLSKRYQNSILYSTSTFKNNKLEGEYIIYDSLGQIASTIIYKEGKPIDKQIIKQNSSHKDQMDKTYKVVEKMPMFDACLEVADIKEKKNCAMKKMLRHIYNNLKYPADAREKSIEGTALIRFVVNKEGNIQDVKPIRGLSQSIEAECIRIIETMPKWVPGEQDGKPVKVQFNLPIKFKLQ